MKLLRIALTDFRGVTASEVRFDAPGVTVVVGPNEIGKSSIAEALTLIRTYKDSSKHRDIVAVKPTHRDVGPQVEIEVETGEFRFVYTKRWSRKPSTELRILAPRAEQLTGDEAHERVEQIFAATLDPELWTALQQVQGASLQQASLAKVTPLHAALSAAADESDGQADETHTELMAAIEARYREFFTKTGTPTGDHARAISDVEELRLELAAVEARLRGVGDRAERHAELTTQRARLVERLDESATELDEFETRFAAIAGLRAAVESAQGKLREAQLAETAARSAIEVRAERVTEAAEARTAATEAVAALAVAEQAYAAHQAEQADHAEARAKARARLDDARTGLADAAQAVEAVRERAELARLTERVDAATETSTRLQVVETQLAANTVDTAALQRLTDAHSAVQTARAAASSGAARVTVHRLGEPIVLVDGDEISDQVAADVLSQTSVEVAGVLRVVVTPDASAADRAAQVGDRQRELEALLSTFGVADLAAARAAAAARDRLREERQQTASTLAGLLDGESIETLRGRAAALADRLDDDGPSPVDVDARLIAAQAEFEEAEAVVEASSAESEAHTTRGQQLHGALIRAQTRLDSWNEAVDRAQLRLDADRESNPDAALEAALAATGAELADATTVASAARSALQQHDAEVLEAELDNARSRQARQSADLTQLTREIAMLEGELEALGRDGLHDAAEAVRSRLEDATRVRDALQSRAAAAKLLFQTMSAHQLAARQRYVDPFRTSITALGKVVFGPDFAVEIGDDLSIVSRTLDGVTVPFESLSGGAREQLSVIGRLATARLVSADEGAPVLLDDSLGFTDAARRRKLAAVLNLVGSTAQIIILTCEPERFADIGNATTVTLSPLPV